MTEDAVTLIQRLFAEAGQGRLRADVVMRAIASIAEVGNLPLAAGLFKTWLAHTIELKPHFDLARFERGTELERSGQLAEALDAWGAALLEMHPFHLTVPEALAKADAHLRQAQELWAAVVRVQPNNPVSGQYFKYFDEDLDFALKLGISAVGLASQQ